MAVKMTSSSIASASRRSSKEAGSAVKRGGLLRRLAAVGMGHLRIADNAG